MIFPPKTYTELIKNQIEEALKDPEANKIAAFDADGTCWFSDVGRNFFEYQIRTNFFSGPSYNWSDYKKKEDQDIKIGLFWLAQILENFTVDEVRKFGDEFNQTMRPQFIEHQKEIIKFLTEKDVKVHIVTASVKWTVEAAALEMGVPRENVIGIETEVINGRITSKQKGHLTWKEGKVKALLDHTNGKLPFFVSGNTTSDVPMMKIATHLRQMVRSVNSESGILSSETEALAIAKAEGWNYLDYTLGEFK